jgi:HSP20 family protein
MSTEELIKAPPAPASSRSLTGQMFEPMSRLRSEIDRLFEDFPVRWPAMQLDRLTPRMQLPVPAMEMTETDKAYKIKVEVPGMEAKDIDVTVDDDTLVISGEKKDEREEKERDIYRSERSYGAFERRVSLPSGADAAKIEAKARNGILQITLPKNEKAAASRRKIEVETAK